MSWRFFQDTGLVGGTANPTTDRTVYVDSYNGDDLNVGSNVAPVKTLQKAWDIVVNTFSSASGNIVMAGHFEEGDLVGFGNVGLIAEGYVIIDGINNTDFNAAGARMNCNYTYVGAVAQYDYGKISFRNFSGELKQVINYDINCHNTEFINCLQVFTTSGCHIAVLTKCLFKDSVLGVELFVNLELSTNAVVENNTFINSSFEAELQGTAVFMRNNYFDSTSKLRFNNSTGSTILIGVFDYNFFEGTLTNKIRYRAVYYDNIEAFQADTVNNNGHNANSLPSTTNPLLNSLNNMDFTLQATSPLKNGGVNNQIIGAYGVAAALGASDVAWTVTGVDNTTTAGEAVLTASPTGTMETTAGVQISTVKRLITKINLPDFQNNPALGQLIGSNLTTAITPQLMDVEIQYSDDNVTFNGTWLKVPVNGQPLHDTTNDVGNDDALFDIVEAETIRAQYLKFKITLRDNDVNL